MNTSAYLADHGWKGEGHTLQPSGRGLKKPLMPSQKQNLYGLGKTKGSAITSQWWLNAFDKTLKGFDLRDKKAITESLATQAQAKNGEDTTQAVLNKYFDRAGLYGRFAIGEGLKATMGITNFESVKDTVEEVVVMETSTFMIPDAQMTASKEKAEGMEHIADVSEYECNLPIIEKEGELSRKKQKRKAAHVSYAVGETLLPVVCASAISEERKHEQKQTLLESLKDIRDEKSPALEMTKDGLKPRKKRKQRRRGRKSMAERSESLQHVDSLAVMDNKSRSKSKLKKTKKRKEPS